MLNIPTFVQSTKNQIRIRKPLVLRRKSLSTRRGKNTVATTLAFAANSPTTNSLARAQDRSQPTKESKSWTDANIRFLSLKNWWLEGGRCYGIWLSRGQQTEQGENERSSSSSGSRSQTRAEKDFPVPFGHAVVPAEKAQPPT